MKFDHSTDVLVVGSGGGALAAAVTARILGADVLVVEKADVYGGTSASSGGNVWIPNSHLTNASPFPDTRENALEYLLTAIGDSAPRAIVEAFVDQSPRMLKFLEDNSHVRFDARAYCDYYSELPGAKPEGYRTLEPAPMHGKYLGRDLATLNLPHHGLLMLGRYTWTNTEGIALLKQSTGWQLTVLKIVARYWADIPGRLQGKRSRRLTGGNALIGRLRRSMNDRGVPLWLSSPLVELISEGGRVRGAVVMRNGQRFAIEARRGVIMGAGGFEHDAAMREQYLPKPTSSAWSAAVATNTGDAHKAGMAIGAATGLMERAWWSPAIPAPGVPRPWALFAERGSPGQIMVDQLGRRYVDEALPYLEAGEAMYLAPLASEKSVPSFIVVDAEFRRKYPLGPLPPTSAYPESRLPREWQGTVYFKADTLEELARKAGIDAAGLKESVRRNNEYARTGKDLDFGKGDSAYDRYYGDERVQPNPCLAPIGKAPFYAVVTYPGDIGTKGGLTTDEHACVQSTSGGPIEGLYAVGNTARCVMGTKYPGAGATIGPAMAFGYIAAHHALGKALA